MAGPVLAQETGTHIKRYDPAHVPDANLSEADRGWSTLISFSTCLIKASPVRANTLLRLLPGEPGYEKVAQNLMDDECLWEGQLNFSGLLVRGALYTAMYRRDFRRSQPALIDPPINFVADAVDPKQPAANLHIVMVEFADCVVRKDTANARDLIIGPIGSAREADALKALSPAFGPCMPEHLSVSFSKPMLEGYLAEALYRDSVAPPKS